MSRKDEDEDEEVNPATNTIAVSDLCTFIENETEDTDETDETDKGGDNEADDDDDGSSDDDEEQDGNTASKGRCGRSTVQNKLEDDLQNLSASMAIDFLNDLILKHPRLLICREVNSLFKNETFVRESAKSWFDEKNAKYVS